MVLLEIIVVPLGTGNTGVSKYVAACHKVLEREEGIKYQVNPYGYNNKR